MQFSNCGEVKPKGFLSTKYLHCCGFFKVLKTVNKGFPKGNKGEKTLRKGVIYCIF